MNRQVALHPLSFNGTNDVQADGRADPTTQLREHKQAGRRICIKAQNRRELAEDGSTMTGKLSRTNFVMELPKQIRDKRAFTRREERLPLQSARAIGHVIRKKSITMLIDFIKRAFANECSVHKRQCRMSELNQRGAEKLSQFDSTAYGLMLARCFQAARVSKATGGKC